MLPEAPLYLGATVAGPSDVWFFGGPSALRNAMRRPFGSLARKARCPFQSWDGGFRMKDLTLAEKRRRGEVVSEDIRPHL